MKLNCQQAAKKSYDIVDDVVKVLVNLVSSHGMLHEILLEEYDRLQINEKKKGEGSSNNTVTHISRRNKPTVEREITELLRGSIRKRNT